MSDHSSRKLFVFLQTEMNHQSTIPCIDLVISRCDEEVAWILDVVRVLSDVHVHVHLYNKGISDLETSLAEKIRDSPNTWLTVYHLQNVGRESHTYLEHVIRMRMRDRPLDGGSDVTVFLQGRMDDHVPCQHRDLARFVESMISEAQEQGGLGESRNHACHTRYGAFNALPGLKVAMFPGVGNSGQDLRGWFCTLLSGTWPWTGCEEGPTWWQNGVFAIRTSRLLSSDSRVDDSYYLALRAEVDWHINPEAGHYLERCWCFVFPPLYPSRQERCG